jgi:hypothetical protein
MGKIVELITVNLATRDVEAALGRWQAIGLGSLAPVHMPAPPAEIVDVTLPVGASGAVSLIAATSAGSPVQRFLDRRGEGVYSIAVRVDNLAEVMREWAAAGVEWVLPEPYEFPPGNPAGRYRPERLKANWVKPASLGGVMLECFEFVGRVEQLA